jgi:hypothetical protein
MLNNEIKSLSSLRGAARPVMPRLQKPPIFLRRHEKLA